MRVKPWLVAALILLPFVGGTFTVIYQNLTKGSTDLYPTWQAAKLFWEDGISPYAEIVGQKNQQAIYGRPALPDEDQVLYAYPFYGIFHIGPLAFMSFRLAAAIYMEGLLLGLLLAMVLNLHILRWLPSPSVLSLLLLWTIIGYFSVRGMLLGQPGLFVYVMRMIALWGIFRQRDSLAGAALAVTMLKPQTGFLIIPLLLLWVWRVQRYRIIFSFIAVFMLMIGLSFLLEPGWLADWLERTRSYTGYVETVPAAHILTHFSDSIPDSVANSAQVILSLLLLLPVFYFWQARLWQGDNTQLLWGYCLTMTVTMLIAPRVATTSYIELYPVLYIIAYLMTQRRQTLWLLITGLAALIGYWVLHIATVPPAAEGAGKEAPIVYVVFPVFLLILLLYYREKFPELNRGF